MSKQVAAFTIMELLVVSLLTALCAAAAFSAFQLFDRQYRDYTYQSEESLRITNLHQLILEEVQLAEEVQLEASNLLCHYVDSTIQYQFREVGIIRTVEDPMIRPDTFKVQWQQLAGFWEGGLRMQGVVDAIQWELWWEGGRYPFSFYKKYSAEALMEINRQ